MKNIFMIRKVVLYICKAELFFVYPTDIPRRKLIKHNNSLSVKIQKEIITI